MNIRTMLLTVGGLGFLRTAPGTWGSLPPVGLALAMAMWEVPNWMANVTLALLALAASIACIKFGSFAEKRFGRKDPQQVVADEVAGQCIALLFLPWAAPVNRHSWMWNIALAAGALLAFRFFDISKIPPAHQLQRLPSGWGVLLDDVMAGVYALIVLQAILIFI